MEEAGHSFVRLEDLQKAVGESIAKMLDVESAMVTSGGASAIMLATAACVTGTDPEKISRVPNLNGMKSEVIVPRGHRNSFDHAARNVGVKLVEVGTLDDLRRAIGPQTAMPYFTNIFEHNGQIKLKEFIEAGRQAGIPVFKTPRRNCHQPAIFRVSSAMASIWLVSVVAREYVGRRVRACCSAAKI